MDKKNLNKLIMVSLLSISLSGCSLINDENLNSDNNTTNFATISQRASYGNKTKYKKGMFSTDYNGGKSDYSFDSPKANDEYKSIQDLMINDGHILALYSDKVGNREGANTKDVVSLFNDINNSSPKVNLNGKDKSVYIPLKGHSLEVYRYDGKDIYNPPDVEHIKLEGKPLFTGEQGQPVMVTGALSDNKNNIIIKIKGSDGVFYVTPLRYIRNITTDNVGGVLNLNVKDLDEPIIKNKSYQFTGPGEWWSDWINSGNDKIRYRMVLFNTKEDKTNYIVFSSCLNKPKFGNSMFGSYTNDSKDRYRLNTVVGKAKDTEEIFEMKRNGDELVLKRITKNNFDFYEGTDVDTAKFVFMPYEDISKESNFVKSGYSLLSGYAEIIYYKGNLDLNLKWTGDFINIKNRRCAIFILQGKDENRVDDPMIFATDGVSGYKYVEKSKDWKNL